MVIRLKDANIDSIDDTETRRLKKIRVASKTDGVTLELELPEALCSQISKSDTINVIIDSKPIPKGEESKLYLEGETFKQKDNDEFQIIGSIGGLHMMLTLANATPAKKKTFDTAQIFITFT
jgi:hypothetical protein